VSVDPLKYRPKPISQRDTLLARDGVDDCRAVAATYLADVATAGEVTTWPNGNQMGRRNRVALVKKARRALGSTAATGPLNTSHTTLMLRYLVPQAPLLRPADLKFWQLRNLLQSGYSASLSGNPADIKGSSPLKRAGNVGHEFFILKGGDKKCLVGDPYRPYRKRFGEWVPWSDVKQFAFRDSDNTLTACFVIKRGEWREAALVEDALTKRLGRKNSQLREQAGLINGQRARIDDLVGETGRLEEQLSECREDAPDIDGFMEDLEGRMAGLWAEIKEEYL